MINGFGVKRIIRRSCDFRVKFMDHAQIRFTLLNLLYQKYYEQPGHPQSTDKIVEEAKLTHLMNDTTGDILYLINKRFIDDQKSSVLGRVLPIMLIITPLGIDIVEAVLDRAITQTKSNIESAELSKEVEKLSTIQSPTEKYKEFYKLIKLHKDVETPSITDIFKSITVG